MWRRWLIAAIQLSLVSFSPEFAGNARLMLGLEYPWSARLGGITGEVEITGRVFEGGKLEAIKVISGVAPLAGPAKANAQSWRFTPCLTVGGCDVTLRYSFVLDGLCEMAHCPTDIEIEIPEAAQTVYKIGVRSKLFDSPVR